MKEKGNPLLQIIRNVNDAVVVVLFLAMTITVTPLYNFLNKKYRTGTF